MEYMVSVEYILPNKRAPTADQKSDRLQQVFLNKQPFYSIFVIR